MAATTFPAALAVPPPLACRARLRVYVKEAKYELHQQDPHSGLRHLDRGFPADVLRALRHRAGTQQPATASDNATYMLATMGCFGVMAVALFGFGVSLAMERGQGWLQVKRASPMPVSAYLLAKLFAAVVFSTVIMLLAACGRNCLRRRASAVRDRGKAGGHSGRGIDPVQRHGPGDRILRQAELGAGRG